METMTYASAPAAPKMRAAVTIPCYAADVAAAGVVAADVIAVDVVKADLVAAVAHVDENALATTSSMTGGVVGSTPAVAAVPAAGWAGTTAIAKQGVKQDKRQARRLGRHGFQARRPPV
ncbi:hypothetical protein EV189_2612 [Motilibacter rhizosphaerae]|uniref:Uncharacterized protein n=1 Tax=Motilibacter rhizosphaerae TaxID=598652 RepID=A0A4Q7NQ33_9ACTN|nr:hypothetical protein [Motilibacter rhizosphaerae]RZS87188.1 hypothetical protein EV189_2612 [Motilibacter rhizosphaerae]